MIDRKQAYNWPPDIKVGYVVEYHPVIGRPESVSYIVRAGPEFRNGYCVVWLDGKPGWVLVDACSPARSEPMEWK